MKLRFGFSFRAWQAYDRANFIFGAIVAVVFLAIMLFVWEGYILYRESLQKRSSPAPIVSELVISSKDLNDILLTIDERADKFNDNLRPK